MKGSPAKMGTISGTAGHSSALKMKVEADAASALKQTQKYDTTDVDVDEDTGNVTTERIKGKEKGNEGDYKEKVFQATDKEGYTDSDSARKTTKYKAKLKGDKYKSKEVRYEKDDSGKITKIVDKRKRYTKDGKRIEDITKKTKTPKTKIGQWWAGRKMKSQERKAEKYKEENK